MALTRRQRSALVALALTTVIAAAPALAQCPDGTPPPCGGAVAQAHPASHSIAVLTFENTTRDTSAQYLAEGLADQISTRLGGVTRLTLISRTAVRRLHNLDQSSVQQVGRALNASYLVSGSIRAAGGRVRINVEAVRAASGEAVWSEAYDRASDDLVGLEEAIATEVATGVAGRLTPQERRALGSPVTANSRAYEQFLRGNVLLARRTPGALQGAVAAYRAAAAADSGFADAYGRLAYALALCWNFYCPSDADSVLLGLSQQASARALRLGRKSSDAWMGRAYLLLMESAAAGGAGADDSLLESLAAFRRAVELNPRNDEAWHQYGATLSWVNDSASLDGLRRALALDPARAITYQDLSTTYYLMSRNDRALATVDSAVALDPDGPARAMRLLYRLTAGDTAGAVADARLTPAGWTSPAVLAAFAHDSAAAREMEAKATQQGCDNVSAMYLLWTGRREQAVQRLLACGASIRTRWSLRFQVFAPLTDDSRIQALRAQSDTILARARWR
jgi:serine/threonine-protein kinase